MNPNKKNYIKGRGAQINTPNPFHNTFLDSDPHFEDDEPDLRAHQQSSHILVHPKTILNKVDSPDIGHSYSLNPYQGCEHGCIYCYARNSHTYWGYSAGIEFEQKILVKSSAPKLLDEKLKSKSWKAVPIMLSGNTDCYQPAEAHYRLTQKILETLYRYRHPVGVITKNALILRDLPLLQKMAQENLVHVAITITTLEESIRSKLEPRTATARRRLHVVKALSEAGIPVSIMMAPIIPSINDHEIFSIAEQTSDAGALGFNYTIIRLNGDVSEIFKNWLQQNFQDRYDRVIHQIEDCHGGQVHDHRFGVRMRGEGNLATVIGQQVKLAKEKFFKNKALPPYNLKLYEQYRDGQLSLF